MLAAMFRLLNVVAFVVCQIVLAGCGDGRPKNYPVLDAPLPPPVKGAEKSATIIVEMIEVDGALFSDWGLSNTLEPTRATPLRRAVQDWLRKDRARLVETIVVQGKDGTRSESKSVREVVYPSEYRYPIITKTETTTDPKDKNKKTTTTTEERMRGVAATGQVFSQQDVGTVLAVDCAIDAETVTVSLAAELAHQMENLEWQAKSGEDVDTFESPSFDRNSFQTSLTLQSGVYGLVGSGTLPESKQSNEFSNPTLLVFLRADLNQPNP